MASESIKKLFEGVDHLVTADKKEHSLDAVLSNNNNNKYVLLYFSAHWCPPCRAFTPLLKRFHDAKSAALSFEVVFVSCDRDEDSFYKYLSTAHGAWYALPFDRADVNAAISERFGVEGVPTLVVLDAATGEKITDAGVEELTADEEGASFPWREKGLWELLGDTLVDHQGNEYSLQDRVKGAEAFALYFSAHWCPPCRAFTPQLVAAYRHLRDVAKKNFEIIFVSSDRDAKSFDEYFAEMPWLALKAPSEQTKGANHPSKAGLSRLFNVQGIPSLVVLDPADGHVINRSGRAAVSSDPQGVHFPWHPRPITDLRLSADGIDEGASFVAFLEGVPKSADDLVRDVFEPLAAQHRQRASGLRFFFNVEEDNFLALQLRSVAGLGFVREVENAAGVKSHVGDLRRWYCGREGIVHCECGRCDGTCGPSNGCNCDDCKLITAPAEVADDDRTKIKLVIFELRKRKFFAFDTGDSKPVDKETVAAFLQDFLDNKLSPSS